MVALRSRATGSGLALVAFAITISGCNGSNAIGPSGNATSQVRSISALQGCPTNVDIEQVGVVPVQFVNVVSNSPPSAYSSLRSGLGLHYGVFPTGTTSGALATANIDLNPHTSGSSGNSGTYTLVATGVCGSGVGVSGPQLVRLLDAFPSSFVGSTAGTVALRVVNLIPDLSGGISLASNGAPLHGSDDAGTNNVAYAGTAGIDSSHYNAGINLTGSPTFTILTNANTVLVTLPTVSLPPNHSYTLFVTGRFSPPGGGSTVSTVIVQDF